MTRIRHFFRFAFILVLTGLPPTGWSTQAVAQAPRAWTIMPNNVKGEGPKARPYSLPDALLPSSAWDEDRRPAGAPAVNEIKTAPKYAFTIEPGYKAYRFTARDKITYAGREVVTPRFPVVVLFAAGLSHVDDANPKYGSNSEAFAKRVGAAAARDGSQRVFSHMLLAPLFHEDSRYYVMGQRHGVWKRVFYAASRIAIVRKDNGKNTLNFAELGGYGGSAALTQLYYPKGGRDLDTMLSTYGSSLGGLAIAHEIEEFVRFLTPGQPR